MLLVKRFDREKTDGGYTKARMVSGLTLLRAEEAPEARDRWSYVLMAEELRRAVAEAKKDASELFRRMVFNALISNIDDHPRNHAVIAKECEWKLSPAYDLTPSPVIAQDRRNRRSGPLCQCKKTFCPNTPAFCSKRRKRRLLSLP